MMQTLDGNIQINKSVLQFPSRAAKSHLLAQRCYQNCGIDTPKKSYAKTCVCFTECWLQPEEFEEESRCTKEQQRGLWPNSKQF